MMNKFGNVKIKILLKIIDSYKEKNMSQIKEVFSLIKENKEFKKMYLFYENIENIYFDDEKVAELYVEELSTNLKNEWSLIKETVKKINDVIGDLNTDHELSNLYGYLDQLMEENDLFNLDKKIIAKKELKEFLLKEKAVVESKTNHTSNQSLLHTILINNYNNLYENILSEEEKKELSTILQLSKEQLTEEINTMKEDISSSVEKLLFESSDDSLKSKLNSVKTELIGIIPTKYNYYRLKNLKISLL